MSAPQLIHKTPNFVFWELPLGKPDQNAPCSPEILENDTRPRVRQDPCEEATCWHDAIETIREQIGNHPTPELTEQKKLENHYYTWREAVSKHETSLPAIFALVEHPTVREVWTQWQHHNAINESLALLFEPLSRSSEKQEKISLLPYTQQFVKQEEYKNFYEYACHIKLAPRIKINEEFLKYFEKTPEKMFTEAFIDPNYQSNFQRYSWENMPKAIQIKLLDMFAKEICAEAYGLRKSSWTPFQEVSNLISELKHCGPLVVGGIFGRRAYSEKPFTMKESVGKRSTYGWRQGTRIDYRAGHTITIIGAKQLKDKGFVYYVDPEDPSDPKDITAQKIYVISYKSLKENVAGCRAPWPDHIAPSPYGYAWAAKKAPASS